MINRILKTLLCSIIFLVFIIVANLLFDIICEVFPATGLSISVAMLLYISYDFVKSRERGGDE